MGTSCVVGFIRVRAAGLCVHLGWLGSLGCDLGVAAGPLCSPVYNLGVVGFIWVGTRVRPGDRWIHPGPLGSLVYNLGVVGFNHGGTRVRARVVGFILGHWVHSVVP